MSYQDKKIVIIGAGVMGASAALALQAKGQQVCLLDRTAPCAGASFGNAGAVVSGSCIPTGMPGMLMASLKMMNQPLAPLSFKHAYFYKMLPWLVRVLNESRYSRSLKNAQHLYALTNDSAQAWHKLTDNTKLQALLHKGGWLKVMETKQAFAGTLRMRQLMDKVGSSYTLLNQGDIRDLEPQLAPIFKYGIFQENCLRLTNPHAMITGMVDLFVQRGGHYKQFDVQSIELKDKYLNLKSASESLKAEQIVVAAGGWSKTLARQVGDHVPLEVERGYHLMMPQSSAGLLGRPVMNLETSFVLAPMEMGMRLTSQVEFAGIDAPPDYRRVRSLLPEVKRMLPSIDATEKSVWMGCRPSLPDSLPILGFSPKSKRVVYAFGHQHYGITLGPVSGLLIADLMTGRKPKIDLKPYAVNRFKPKYL